MVLNKDGSFQRTAQFRGPDLDSAVPAELVAVAGCLNNAFRRLGSGWAIFVEAQRHAASTYSASTFYVSASAVVDVKRKADFEKAGSILSPATSRPSPIFHLPRTSAPRHGITRDARKPASIRIR